MPHKHLRVSRLKNTRLGFRSENYGGKSRRLSSQETTYQRLRKLKSYDGCRRGLFTQEDPIGLAGGMNLYGFAGGDPVNYSDPFGLCPPQDNQLWDCGSKYYANRMATGKGIWIVNQVAGLINTCVEDERCSNVMSIALAEGISSARGGGIGLSTKDVGDEPLSVNQMNRQATRGQAPRGIERVDVGKVKGEQDNVHFSDGRSLNRDGTWKHGDGSVTNAQREWLEKNGWKAPQ